MKKITLLLAAVLTTVAMNAQCTDYVDGPYINFNNEGGAPEPMGDAIEIDTFETWKSEAYLLDNVIEGESYKFSACNGPGAGSWFNDFTIGPADADNQLAVVDAFGLDDESDCELTFTASASGTYIILVNESDNCGVAGQVDNGFPKIEWVELLSVTDQIFANFDYIAANGALTLSSQSAMENVTIFNISGQEVINKGLSNTSEVVEISSLSNGVYIARVNIDGALKSFKFVK